MKFSLCKTLPGSLLLGFALGACSQIRVVTPTATIYPSEVSSPGSVHLTLRADPARIQTVTTDASARPPVFDNINEGASLLSGNLNFGVTDQLQLSLGLTDRFGLAGQAQLQFLGSSWEKGEEGWSAAVHLDGQASSSTNSGDQKGTFGPGGYKWKATAGMLSLGVGISTGYRWNPGLMTFAGFSANTLAVNTTIDQDAANGDAGGIYEQKLRGDSWAAGLGAHLGSGGFRVIPSVQWVDYRLAGAQQHDIRWALSLEFGGAQEQTKIIEDAQSNSKSSSEAPSAPETKPSSESKSEPKGETTTH